jgi:heptosyltransferase-2
MDLARKIGVESNNLDTEIFLTDGEKRKVNQIREELLKSKKYLIGVHASSGNSSPNWTVNEYRKLILSLTKETGIRVVITDNIIPEQLKQSEGVSYPNEKKSLRESIINFASIDLLISASTGPMHIAAALKVKTLSMFCPLTACSPKLWGPLGNESKIILPQENYCSTVCPGDPKKCSFTDDGGIDAEKVLEETKKFLY